MLYLPWLPLNEGIGFDLEITPQTREEDSNDSKLTVLIQTKNFGNLKGEFTLTTSNSVEVLIICSENFPKKLLQKSLMEESTAHAMNTNIDIEELKPVAEKMPTIIKLKETLEKARERKIELEKGPLPFSAELAKKESVALLSVDIETIKADAEKMKSYINSRL